MIEINFLEIKKINIVPFLLGIIFITLFSGIAGILYWQHQTAQVELEQKRQELTVYQSAELDNADLKQIQQERIQLSEQIDQLNALLFPSVALKDKIIILLPNNSILNQFNYDSQNGVSIDVQMESVEHVALYTNTLQKQPFVTDVIVHNISQLAAGDAVHYNVSVEIEIDYNVWAKDADTNED